MEANLYLSQVDYCRYWPSSASSPCEEFISQMKAGKARPGDYPFLTAKQFKTFKLVTELETQIPPVPLLSLPQPIEAELIPVNEPANDSIVIVTGNNRLTFDLLITIWSQGITPVYFLLVDCFGDTVDMAMVYQHFTPARLKQALDKTGLEKKVNHRQMITPGFTAPLAEDFTKVTGWMIEVGPICAVELPLFLGERWREIT